jgi:hypothetical protein
MTTANPGQPEPASSQAIAAFVLGLLSVGTCCGLLGPIAWYIGHQELKAIHQGRSPASGEWLARFGRGLGILGMAMMLMLLLWLFFMGGLAIVSVWLHS